ncbi:hypothetical protein [Microbacterium sp. NPDC058345]|uniref:hypothetical protein n=1 Tax=Microbacterium sp. NPDC058345 TaxID=3346455 RepID=UPI0036689196
MTDFLDVDVLGLRTRIEFGEDLDATQRRRAHDAWSGARRLDHGIPDLTHPLTAGADFDRAMERLTVDVTLSALERLRGRALMFHAAGVADPAGHVAAFVGPSGRGKTTLSRELGRHGAYVSDETIAVDDELRVQPYRKPLSVVREARPKEQVSPMAAGLRDLPDAELSLTALMLMDRDAALPAPEVVDVPLAEALPELVAQMSYLRDQDLPLQTLAALCDAVGGVRRLRYADASTVAALLPQLSTPRPSVSEWEPAPEATTTGPYDVSCVDDAIVSDRFVIAMAQATLHVLDGIAPTVWLAAGQGRDLDGIVDAVIDEYGEPPQGNARALVVQAIDELIAAGVLRRR